MAFGLGCTGCGSNCEQVNWNGMGALGDDITDFLSSSIDPTISNFDAALTTFDTSLPSLPTFVSSSDASAIPNIVSTSSGATTTSTGTYTYPATPTTTNSTSSVANSINWNAILQTWTNAGAAIAKTAAGANPTYQSYNPLTGATTTVFGDSTTAASLISSLATPTLGGLSLGTLLLLGGGALLIFGMMPKGH
jgi:hypothetical protein